jgi:23S rRNA (adenine2503-C2)-methyltransferase
MPKKNLKALTKNDVHHFFRKKGLPPYRERQLLHWIYEKNAQSIDDITEFSKELRNSIKKDAYLSVLHLLKRQVSHDGTEKYLFALEDENTIEAVMIPEHHRRTLCISSQVGCAMGCRFCLTAQRGFTRNLKAYEIVDQILAVNRLIDPATITNIVFMGMGEPLANMNEVIPAIQRIVEILNISKRKITLSTAGITPLIMPFARKSHPVNFAFSLNATTDEIRNRIMPINKKYPFKTVLDVLKKYPLESRRKLTIEYVLIRDVNDRAEDAQRLVDLLNGIRCKVNIIPLNPYDGLTMKRPSEIKTLAFQHLLTRSRMRAFIRDSRGKDILAACGQLRATTQKID